MSALARIRDLGTNDLEAYIALRQESLADSPLSFGAAPDTDRLSDAAFLEGLIGNPEQQLLLVAEREGRLIGTASALRASGVKRGHRADVYAMYVTPAERGQGVARSLMEALLARLRAWGVERVDLSVTDAAPAARGLYRSLGFVEWGEDPDSLRWKGRSTVEHHMTLRWSDTEA